MNVKQVIFEVRSPGESVATIVTRKRSLASMNHDMLQIRTFISEHLIAIFTRDRIFGRITLIWAAAVQM